MKRRKDGRYQKSKTINGKRVIFYSSESTERKALRDIETQMLAYAEKLEKGKTFIEVTEEWDKKYISTVEVQTYARNKSLIRYAKEYFDDQLIKTITSNQIVSFLDSRIELGYASKSISNQLSVLNTIFKYACVNNYIQVNPCQYITVPRGLPKSQRKFPTEDEIEIVKESLNAEFGLLAYFILYTGLRRGEILALTYGDIDRKNNLINIDKSVYWDSNTPHLKKPKTEAGIRKCILLDVLAKKVPHGLKNNLIFPDENGGLMRKSVFEKLWGKYKKATGLKLTPHQFRHAYASYILYDAGVDVKVAQELLGHASIEMTRNIYTHISQTKLKETTQKLNDFVSA